MGGFHDLWCRLPHLYHKNQTEYRLNEPVLRAKGLRVDPDLAQIDLSPKVARIASEALGHFQRGDVDNGVRRLGRAYALQRKTSPTRTPLINVVAYLGLLNDLPATPKGEWGSSHRLVMRHTGVSALLEEWTFERAIQGQKVSENFHAACRRFCEDVPLSEEMRGDQDQIGLVAAILREHGAPLENPAAAMSAIENCLATVSQISPPPPSSNSQRLGAENPQGSTAPRAPREDFR